MAGIDSESESAEIEKILSVVDNSSFEEDDWNIVISECSSLAARWEQVSGFLGLRPSLIANIRGNHTNNNTGCWNDALFHWITQNYNIRKFGEPSWKSLLKAIFKVDKLLCKELSTKHQASASTTKSYQTLPTYILKNSEECFSTSRDMMYNFQKLFLATRKSLREKKVSALELISHIECLGATKPTYIDIDAGEKPLRCLLPTPENAKTRTADDIMSVVNHYCSFFNYQMLEHIINELGTEQDKQNLTEYKTEFNKYAMSRVIECPAEFGEIIDGHADMLVTLDESFDNCAQSHLYSFMADLRKVLNIKSDVELRLCRIKPGSIKITFQLPHYVQEAIFRKSLLSGQKVTLGDLGVVELTCGDYKFIRQSENEEKNLCKIVAGVKIKESIMHTEPIQKGKHCVALVEGVYADITRGCLDGVEERLDQIKEIANELAEQYEQRTNKIEEVEKKYKERTEEIERKIGELGCQLEEKWKVKSDLEASLSNKQAKLAAEKTALSNAERELGDAERKLRHAKRKRKRRGRLGGLAGAVVGSFIAPGIGTTIGAAGGVAVGGAVGGDFVGAARRRVDRCKGQVQRAESDVSSTRKELSDIEAQIASLLQQCGSLEKQKLQYNDEAKKMEKAVLLSHRASMQFQQISKRGVVCTALMQKVIHKPKEKEDKYELKSMDTAMELEQNPECSQ